MIRIGIDAMGGDFAPNNVILGVIEALSYIGTNTKIFLIGDEKKITEVCQHYGVDSGNFVIVHAPETIEMGEHPVRAFLKKKRSSLVVGFNMLAGGEIDVLASAGNTGAMLAGSVQVLNNILVPDRLVGIYSCKHLTGKGRFDVTCMFKKIGKDIGKSGSA